MDKILIGCDFSVNKPALSLLKDGTLKFFFFPLSLTKKEEEMWAAVEDVECTSRNLESMSTKDYTSSSLAKEHIARAVSLSDMIVRRLEKEIGGISSDQVFFSSEGLSFGSFGDATLNLATYKGIFLSKLYEVLKIENMFTYSPITIKATANCAKREKSKNKLCMIEAFAAESLSSDFRSKVADGSLKSKTNFIHGTDDIVDSYWCLKTMQAKEKL